MTDLIARGMLRAAAMIESGGPGSGPQGGSGGSSSSGKSYPTKAQSDKAVAESQREIATARENLDRAMARDINSDPTITALRQKSADLDRQKAEINKKADEKKAAIAQKYAAKKAEAEKKFQQRMKEAGL
jgi:uncharacterized protein involved in exopolysaccharide biosynthesis